MSEEKLSEEKLRKLTSTLVREALAGEEFLSHSLLGLGKRLSLHFRVEALEKAMKRLDALHPPHVSKRKRSWFRFGLGGRD